MEIRSIQQNQWFGYLGLGGVLGFIISILLLHGFQPELSVKDDAMSYYVYGQHGWLLPASLIFLGLGSVLVGIGLVQAFQGVHTKIAAFCVMIWGIGLALAAIFPTDAPGNWDQPPSTEGIIHFSAAMMAWMTLLLASLLLAKKLLNDSRWQSVRKWVIPLTIVHVFTFVLLILSFLPIMISPGPPFLFGVTERIHFLSNIAWLSLLAMGLLNKHIDVNKFKSR